MRFRSAREEMIFDTGATQHMRAYRKTLPDYGGYSGPTCVERGGRGAFTAPR